ncbi:MAG TPA: ATP-binding cassette domain-containing protein [Candidatus Solibacter sp.]|nr:ATP-binding cassette domain-containing protein [Candidatus Solibacter sp.]
MSRRFLVPEVIQTSAMDCGPASLKALFGGFGLYLSYGRLREACQTDVDGSSIDTLEEVAGKLGLEVAQLLMPADLLCLDESACLPAIVVVRLPGGATHFVVLWRLHGPLVQVMDPAAGRIWIPRRRFLDSLYIHQQAAPRAAWEEWSQGAAFTAGLERRMRGLGVAPDLWADRAHLDAALRLGHALLEAGKLKRGAPARDFLGRCARNPEQIPAEFWTVRPSEAGADELLMRGAVLLAAAGRCKPAPSEPLPESLAAVRSEPPPRVWAPVWAALREGGWRVPGIISLGLVAAAAGTVCEALLFRGLFDLARHLQLSGQRMAALAAVLIFLAGLLALEWPAALGLLRLGRHLELRLRARFLLKVPRLSDRYFQSRLISDMAFRAHSLQTLRELPELAGQFVRLAAGLLFTAAAIAWLYPGAALPAALAVAAAIGVPLLFQPALVERDLRFREIGGALSRFYLDALMGSRAIQAHGAERALRAAQAGQLAQWAEAGLRQQALLVRAGAVQMALTMTLGIGLVYRQTAAAQNPAGLLLLIYWLLSIPSTGRQLASIVWNLPALRNTLLRFLEPLGTPEHNSNEEDIAEAEPAADRCGAGLEFDEVTVIAGGHTILDQVSLRVVPGEHVAIVGLSGAGKSSLVGLLLGWHKPVAGVVRVDGAPLDAPRLAQLRRQTAWIDPMVHLFNATLFDNLAYGNGGDAVARMGSAMEDAGLDEVLERLPDGLQTTLGEGGGLVSGGEGQRARMARALARPGIRLAILDEPARGLHREQRHSFVATARRRFAGVTLLCVTHDVTETLDFERVLVVEQGRILEQGSPPELCRQSGSRYRALLDREEMVRRELWSHPLWRRLRMTDGVLREGEEARQWTSA